MKYVFTTCACKCTRVCTNCEGVVKYTTSCCERNNEKGSPGLHHTLHGAIHWGWHSQVPGSHHSRVLQMPQEQEEQDQLPCAPQLPYPQLPHTRSTEWPWEDPERSNSHLKSLPFLLPFLPSSLPSWPWLPWRVTLTPLYQRVRVEELRAMV